MGFDLSNLPDLKRELIIANLKFAASYIAEVKGVLSSEAKTTVELAQKAIDGLSVAVENKNWVESVLNSKNEISEEEIADQIAKITSLLNSITQYASSFSGGEMNPFVEAGKFVQANLNTIYEAHKRNWEIATSYEDVVFFPLKLEVMDDDGNKTVMMRNVSVRVARAQ